MAEFFRVSGGSTQLKGVEPDIRFDLGPDLDDHGERSLENALPWDRIRPARYSRYGAGRHRTAAPAFRAADRQDDGFRMLARAAGCWRDQRPGRGLAA
jgi:carboxyl-terminal processing protease